MHFYKSPKANSLKLFQDSNLNKCFYCLAGNWWVKLRLNTSLVYLQWKVSWQSWFPRYLFHLLMCCCWRNYINWFLRQMKYVLFRNCFFFSHGTKYFSRSYEHQKTHCSNRRSALLVPAMALGPQPLMSPLWFPVELCSCMPVWDGPQVGWLCNFFLNRKLGSSHVSSLSLGGKQLLRKGDLGKLMVYLFSAWLWRSHIHTITWLPAVSSVNSSYSSP